MNYPLVTITKLFVYKAVPDHLIHRIVKLPAQAEIVLAEKRDFSLLDNHTKQGILRSEEWEKFPEFNLTGCGLIDALVSLVHQYGYRRLNFYVKKLGLRNSMDLRVAVKVLTGENVCNFLVGYTLEMVRDLERRTNLQQKEIGEVLCFSTPQGFSQFLRIYDK